MIYLFLIYSNFFLVFLVKYLLLPVIFKMGLTFLLYSFYAFINLLSNEFEVSKWCFENISVENWKGLEVRFI